MVKIICSVCSERELEGDITMLEIDGKLHFKCENCYEKWIGKSRTKKRIPKDVTNKCVRCYKKLPKNHPPMQSRCNKCDGEDE